MGIEYGTDWRHWMFGFMFLSPRIRNLGVAYGYIAFGPLIVYLVHRRTSDATGNCTVQAEKDR